MPRFLAPLAAAALVALPAAAQVGYAPDRSPYRELTNPTTLTATVGRFTSNGGSYGLGPNNGYTYGLRYAFRANKFIEISLNATRMQLERLQVDPFVPVAQRTTGPFAEPMIMGEFGLTANLTGGKTWRGLAPFVGVGLGAAFSEGFQSPSDTTGFRQGTKFVFTPHAGTRIFLSSRLHVRLEAKAVFWRLSYPRNTFGAVPPADPTAAPVVTDGRFTQWAPNGLLQVGVGYAIGLL